MDFQTLVARVIQQESGGNPNAVSPVGAAGLMQIMPATARDPGFGLQPLDWGDVFDPVKNRAFGEAYLQAMLNRYGGDYERGLAAYNWGAGNADKWSGNRADLPEETRGYLANILDKAPTGPAGAPVSITNPQAPQPTFLDKATEFAGLLPQMQPVEHIGLLPIQNNFRPRTLLGNF